MKENIVILMHVFAKNLTQIICLLAPVVSQVTGVPYVAVAASNRINLRGLVEPSEIAISVG